MPTITETIVIGNFYSMVLFTHSFSLLFVGGDGSPEKVSDGVNMFVVVAYFVFCLFVSFFHLLSAILYIKDFLW